jgi:tellurite resistance-related uncharacterized protein
LIIVKLQGGLGNQMFQYAVGKALACFYNTSLRLDHGFLESRAENATHVFREYNLDLFNLRVKRASSRELNTFFKSGPIWKKYGVRLGLLTRHEIVNEPHFQFYPELFNKHKHLYLDGYWQSPKYFESIKAELRNDFAFRKTVDTHSFQMLKLIEAVNSVCVNVRRTDFLINSFHAQCALSYYKESMTFVSARIANPTFFVFSDDIAWCYENFAHLPNCIIVDHTHKGDRFSNYLMLMASCKHFIIANSTFAWWAVWLANRENNIVIAPQKWFTDPSWRTEDLLPEQWQCLDNKA